MSATEVLTPDRSSFRKTPTLRFSISEPEGGARTLDLPGRRIRVGSRPENDIVLSDAAVSGIHFEVSFDDTGCRLRDVGSTNGTFVDDYRVGSLYLRSGSVVSCGRCRLVVEILDNTSQVALSTEDRFGPLVGTSEPMRELFADLEKVAPTEFTVLIEGETGTGKELVAEALHRASQRAGGPFVVFDCSAVAPTLLESLLFGHEKGAFTGAHSQHIGCLEEAHDGTLFLDELGELPLELQGKLLRALENGTFRRVGGTEALCSNARVLAATNRDLASEVNQGSFRADLYYRVAVVRVVVPALRERTTDISALVRHFAMVANNDDLVATETFIAGLSDEEWTRLRQHPWPGNVRELRNAVHRRLAMGKQILSDARQRAPVTTEQLAVQFPVNLDRAFLDQKKEILAEFEQRYLTAQLERHDGVVARAARSAEIDRMYYRRLLKKHQ